MRGRGGCLSGCGAFLLVLGGGVSLFNAAFGIGLSTGVPFTYEATGVMRVSARAG